MLHPPEPANLIIGVIARNAELLNPVRSVLEQIFGPVDDQSDLIDFNFTNYYEKEMGAGLKRIWLSFHDLRSPNLLADDKVMTTELEAKWRDDNGNRQVNLDPGLLSKYNLVLTTTKNYAHRIYIGKGIYAELTLLFEHGTFYSMRWTYPDYQSETCQRFLERVRAKYIKKLGQ